MATSLSSQLASISSQSISHGSRSGIHAAAASSSSSSRRRLVPSILYNNAREASSISLITLRENAVVAWTSLWREVVSSVSNSNNNNNDRMMDDDDDDDIIHRNDSSMLLANANKLLSISHLNHYERGTSTNSENEIMDGYIIEMLMFLMTCLVEEQPHATTTTNNSSSSSSSSSTLMSCLHIIEYLLRKYEIHTRANTASVLLQTILPFHVLATLTHGNNNSGGGGGDHDGDGSGSGGVQQEKLVFSRVLTLLHDLLLHDGHHLPQWSFLLPYAASSSSSSSSSSPSSGPIILLNRHKLAKFVAKEDAMTQVIVNIGKKAMEIGLMEGRLRRVKHDDNGDDGDGGGALNVRRGISTLISFSASILVEACSIQLLSNKDTIVVTGVDTATDGGSSSTTIVGGVRESYVRVLFPVVLSACKTGCVGGRKQKKESSISSSGSSGSERDVFHYCPEWKEWGRILASTLATSCPFLGHNVKIALCDAIVDGLSPRRRSPTTALDGSGDDVNAVSSQWIDDACSAIMTLLSILSTMNDENSARSSPPCDGDDEEDSTTTWQYYLPMLPPPRRRSNLAAATSTSTVVDYLGCELPTSTYKRMLLSTNNASTVSMALGSVLKCFCGELEEGDDDDNDEAEEEEEEEERGRIMERLTPLLASIIMHAFVRLEKEATQRMKSSSFSGTKKKKNPSRSGDDCVEGAIDEEFKADREVQIIVKMVSGGSSYFIVLLYYGFCTTNKHALLLSPLPSPP